MSEIQRTYTCSRWRTSVASLTEVLRRIAELVSDNSGAGARMHITLREAKEDEDRYGSLSEFTEAVSLDDLKRTEAVQVEASTTAAKGPTVSLLLSATAQPSVRLVVEGEDRVRVEGIRGELRALFERQRPWLPAMNAISAFLIFGLGGVFVGVGFGSVDLSFLPDNALGAVLAGILFLLVLGIYMVLGTAAVKTLLPPLEWLGEDGKSRLTRWRIALAGFAVTVATSVIAKVIADQL